MYKKIRSHPTPVKVYGKKLIDQKVISDEDLENVIKKFKDLLDDQFKNAKEVRWDDQRLNFRLMPMVRSAGS